MLKKILIVDDNENNRILLRSIIEMYTDDNAIETEITEAVDGMDASMVALNDHFDLIFMDIMMPKMNGIEATQKIRQFNSKSLIVAVSAADDETLTHDILNNGAEDYISKPVNVDIFTSRLKNYFSLIETRGTKKLQNADKHNLFSDNIFDRYLAFNIKNDDSLAEFWEYYLLNAKKSYTELIDTVRLIFDLISEHLIGNSDIKIIVEESNDYTYFTLINLAQLETLEIDSMLQKHNCHSAYKTTNNLLSFQAAKKQIISEAVEVDTPSAPKIVEVSVQNTIFTYIEGDDLEDLRGYISTLNSLLLLVGNDIERHEALDIAQYIDRISKITTVYTQSYPIGHALASMSREIHTHIDLFLSSSSSLAPLCAAFGRDLDNWIQMIFVNGAPSVDYLDETICSNVDMFINYLTSSQTTQTQYNTDDIFDF